MPWNYNREFCCKVFSGFFFLLQAVFQMSAWARVSMNSRLGMTVWLETPLHLMESLVIQTAPGRKTEHRQKLELWYSWTTWEERLRDRYWLVHLTQQMYKPYICLFSGAAQAIYIFPDPSFLFSLLDTPPDTADRACWCVLSNTRTQKVGVISCAPFPGSSHTSRRAENPHPAAQPHAEKDTLPKHNPHQIWPKTQFPPPRQMNQPCLCSPALAIGTTHPEALLRGHLPRAPLRSSDFGEGSLSASCPTRSEKMFSGSKWYNNPR